MAENDYKFVMKKIFIEDCVFNDVFSRFYHQLSFQDKFVLKDFFKTAQELSAQLITAVVETVFQRISMSDKDQEKFIDKVYKEWEKCNDYEILQNDTDSFHDVRKVIGLVRTIVNIAMAQISDKQIEESEDVKNEITKKMTGDFDPIFVFPENIPPISFGL